MLDSRRILFLNDTAGGFTASVGIINSDGRGRRVLYRGGCCIGPYSRPIWSPNGMKIAVSAVSPKGIGIIVMDADGHVLQTIDSRTDAPADVTWQSVAPRH